MNSTSIENRTMADISDEGRRDAVNHLKQLIRNCQNMLMKFTEGTSQHTLLVNRISSLKAALYCLERKEGTDSKTVNRFEEILEQLSSILRKTQKALDKAKEDSSYSRRLEKIIRTMNLAIVCLSGENIE